MYSLRPHEHDPCKVSWAMVTRSYDTRRELLGRDEIADRAESWNDEGVLGQSQLRLEEKILRA